MNLEQKIAIYISRYAPSKKKLLTYISRKTYALVGEELLEKIGYHESLMMDMWIRSFIAMGKGEQVIRQKLLLKGFEKKDIDMALIAKKEEIRDWDDFVPTISSKISTLQSRGKSKLQIGVNLIGAYPYFREEIEALLEDLEDHENLEKEWTKLQTKYNIRDRKDREKCIASLMRKGYSYDAIKRVMKGENEDTR